MLSQFEKDLKVTQDNSKSNDHENECEGLHDIECGYVQTQIVRVNKSKCKHREQSQSVTQANKSEVKIDQENRNKTEEEKLCSMNEIPNELQNVQETPKEFHTEMFNIQNEKLSSNQIKQRQESEKGQELVEIKEIAQNNQKSRNDVESQVQQSTALPSQMKNCDGKSKQKDDEMACRICLDSDSSPETGDLLNICECKGSLKYIHRVCLWLQLSSKVKLDEFERNDSQFKCELCKTPYRIQVGVKYALQPFDRFKAQLMEQIKPIIVFLILTVCSTVFSFLLVDFIQNEGVGKKKSAIGFMYYMFVSFVVTTAFVSFLVLVYLFIRAAVLKKVSLLQVFQKKEDYNQFQSRSRSRSRTTTAASIQNSDLIVLQPAVPQNNQVIHV